MSNYHFQTNGTGKRVLQEALEIYLRTLMGQRQTLTEELQRIEAETQVTRDAIRNVNRTYAADSPLPEGKVGRMESALKRLEADGCRSFTTGLGSCFRHGRTIDAEFDADRVCEGCLAHHALCANEPVAEASE